MAPPTSSKIQAPLRRFLYESRLRSATKELYLSQEHDLALALHDHVKLDSDCWIAELGLSPLESDCQVVEALSTPVKLRVPYCIMVGEITASEVTESRKQRKNYNQKQHFQDSSAAKLPWAEAVVGVDMSIIQGRCKVCFDVERSEKLPVLKIDSLYKYASRRRVMADIRKSGVVSIITWGLTNTLRMSMSSLLRVGRLSSRRCLQVWPKRRRGKLCRRGAAYMSCSRVSRRWTTLPYRTCWSTSWNRNCPRSTRISLLGGSLCKQCPTCAMTIWNEGFQRPLLSLQVQIRWRPWITSNGFQFACIIPQIFPVSPIWSTFVMLMLMPMPITCLR